MASYKNDPIGTKHSQYSTRGPFMCSRCIHAHDYSAKELTCDHPKVELDAKAGLIDMTADEKPLVGKGAEFCCEYFR